MKVAGNVAAHKFLNVLPHPDASLADNESTAI
jgi:hypothetical protein